MNEIVLTCHLTKIHALNLITLRKWSTQFICLSILSLYCFSLSLSLSLFLSFSLSCLHTAVNFNYYIVFFVFCFLFRAFYSSNAYSLY